MKKIYYFMMALVAMVFMFSLSACSDDTTISNEVSFPQPFIKTYMPSGTVSIPVKLSNSNTKLKSSDIKVEIADCYSSAGDAITPTAWPTFTLLEVQEGDVEGEYNIVVNIDLNKQGRVVVDLIITCFGEEHYLEFICCRAHQLESQEIAPEGDGYYNVEELLATYETTLDRQRITFSVIKEDGSFTLSDLPGEDEYYSIGYTNKALYFTDFGYLSVGKSYSFIVRLQRSENVSDGYVWFELPVVCRDSQ